MLFHETTPLPCFHDLVPRKASTPTSLSLLAGGCSLPRRGPTTPHRSPTPAFPPNGKRRLGVYHSFKTFVPPSINPPSLLLCCLGRYENQGIITTTTRHTRRPPPRYKRPKNTNQEQILRTAPQKINIRLVHKLAQDDGDVTGKAAFVRSPTTRGVLSGHKAERNPEMRTD